jgi:hypothetical protein
MIMSAISSTPAAAPAMAGQSRAGGPIDTLKRLWVAYIGWRIEQAAVGQLRHVLQ